MPYPDEQSVDKPCYNPFVSTIFLRRKSGLQQTVQHCRNISERHTFWEVVENTGDSLVASACRQILQQGRNIDGSEGFAVHPMNHLGAQSEPVGVRSELRECRFRRSFAVRPNPQQRNQCVKAFCIGRLGPHQDISQIVLQRGKGAPNATASTTIERTLKPALFERRTARNSCTMSARDRAAMAGDCQFPDRNHGSVCESRPSAFTRCAQDDCGNDAASP